MTATYAITEELLRNYRNGTATFEDIEAYARWHPLPATAALDGPFPDNYWHCPFRKGCEDGESWCSWPCEKWARWHDASLLAAAREQWEKEHTPKFHSENPDKFTPWYNVEMVAARVKVARADAAKQERERILAAIEEWATAMAVIHNFAEKVDYGWRQAMEQLREKTKYIRVAGELRSCTMGDLK